MSWEAVSPIVATIIGVILTWYVWRKRKKGWKRIWLSGNIPMWLVVKVYEQWYSNRDNLPRRDLLIPGAYYIYNVISKNKDMHEVRARVNNMIVYRKEPDGV